MKELVDRLQQECGFDFYFIERPQGNVNCVTYNYITEGIVSDGLKEESKYNFYLLLVCDKSVTKNIKILEDTLYNNNFIKISIQQTIKTVDGAFQTSITATKII